MILIKSENMLNLREYQHDVCAKVWDLFYPIPLKPEYVCVTAPTGAGKTILIAELCKRFIEINEWKVLVLAHRKELLIQNESALDRHGLNTSIFCAGLKSKDLSSNIVVASQGSFTAKNLKDFNPDAIICDECHRINLKPSGRYRKLIKESNAHVVGLTATPFRLVGKENLSIIRDRLNPRDERLFTKLIKSITISELIHRNYLSIIKPFAPVAKDAGIKRSRLTKASTGDFKVSDIFESHKKIVSKSIDDLIPKIKDRKQVLVFCASIEHCNLVQKELDQRNESCAVVTGESMPLFRESTIESFKNFKIKILIGCDIFTEGFDCPTIDCVVLFRPTQSAALYCQMIGRGLRISENKEDCLILDYGENVTTHGNIENIKISHKYIKSHSASTVFCYKCGYCMPSYPAECPECGLEFPKEPKKRGINTKTTSATDFLLGAGSEEPLEEYYENYQIHVVVHKTKAGKFCLRRIFCKDTPLNEINLLRWQSKNHIKSEYLNFGTYFTAKTWREWSGISEAPPEPLEAMWYLYTHQVPCSRFLTIQHQGSRLDFDNVKLLHEKFEDDFISIDTESIQNYIEEKNITKFPDKYYDNVNGRNFYYDVIFSYNVIENKPCPF